MAKSSLLVCAATLLLVLALASVAAAAPDRRAMFERFKARFNRTYVTPQEEAKRFGIFCENMDIAERHSARNPHATFGINGFSDISAAEFKVHHNGEGYFAQAAAQRSSASNPHLMTKQQIAAAFGAAPTVIDWRTKGAVTPIKNQGLKCGSCWSFSTTGNIEGQWFLAGNTLTSLSEQELVSCDTTDGGCGGGLPDNAFQWLLNTQGGAIDTEASYPYVSGDGNVPACALSGRVTGATISGYHDIAQDEASMLSYMAARGPISIGVDGSSFQTYTGGIVTNCVSQKVDHAVLIVGADTAHNPPYWIVKNQWGLSWGEDGYIRLEYGTDQCLITTAPSSSYVGSAPVPPPPAPPAPPTPPSPPSPPSPSGGNYTYYVCQDSACSQCQSYSFPNGACIDDESDSDSFRASCSAGGSQLEYDAFPNSQSCRGTAERQAINANTCYQDQQSGLYVQFSC